MIRTFGQMPKKKPEGMGARVHFPVLARMDFETGDHRVLDSAGGDTRDLPLSIRAQFASTHGHDGALVTGALYTITFDPETGIAVKSRPDAIAAGRQTRSSATRRCRPHDRAHQQHAGCGIARDRAAIP